MHSTASSPSVMPGSLEQRRAPRAAGTAAPSHADDGGRQRHGARMTAATNGSCSWCFLSYPAKGDPQCKGREALVSIAFRAQKLVDRIIGTVYGGGDGAGPVPPLGRRARRRRSHRAALRGSRVELPRVVWPRARSAPRSCSRRAAKVRSTSACCSRTCPSSRSGSARLRSRAASWSAINPTRRGAELARDMHHTDCQLIVTEPMSPRRCSTASTSASPRARARRRVGATMRRALAPFAGAPIPDVDGRDVRPAAAPLHLGHERRAEGGDLHAGQAVDRLADGRGNAGLGRDTISYQVMPMFHSNALFMGIGPTIVAGGTAVLRRRFSASAALPDIRKYGCNYMNYVGKPLSYILAQPERDDDGDNPLRLAFGNEAADLDIERFAKRFDVRVVDNYGSTETGATVIRVAETCRRARSVAPTRRPRCSIPRRGRSARPRSSTREGRLANAEQAIGELVNTGGKALFEGYYKNDVADRQRMRDGMYWTGDLAYRDADGFLYFAGRDFEWLRVDGENFAAAPVERILARYPGVVLAAVYAVPDEEVGDQVMAALQLAEPERFDPADFDAFLARTERPRHEVVAALRARDARSCRSRRPARCRSASCAPSAGSAPSRCSSAPQRASRCGRMTRARRRRAARAVRGTRPRARATLISRRRERGDGNGSEDGFRRGRGRRGLRRASSCSIACASAASRRACSRRAAGSAAPGSGTATRARAATSRASSTPISSPRSSSRSGSGASATPPSPRSCATSSTSPTASICAATSSSTRACAPRTWNDASARWHDRDRAAERSPRASCIMATGCLSSANMPDFPGRDSFAGTTYHTGRWPHGGVDFTGQRVAVIGTGSSAIQSIPLIAEQAAHLTVFQRTPSYSIPAHNAPLDPELVREVKADYAGFRQRNAAQPFGANFPPNPVLALAGRRAPSATRVYEERWQIGGLGFITAFGDLLFDREANETAAEFVRGEDPRDRARPGRGGEALAQAGDRLQAPVRRHRLLRDVQPAERLARRRLARRRSRRSRRAACASPASSTRSTRSCSPPASTR